MRRFTSAALFVLALTSIADAAPRTRFWNLTAHTVNGLWIAPAGTTNWGANQTLNDDDKTVDHDERLRIKGVATGTYDVKLTDVKGRSCIVSGVQITEGDIFTIDEADLPKAKCGKK